MSGLVAGGAGYIGSHTCVELLEAGYDIIVVDPRRPGDIAEFYTDPQKVLNEMGWTAQLSMEDVCASSWKWQSMNPNRYRG